MNIANNKRLVFDKVLIYIMSFSASGIGIILNFFLARVLQAEVYGRLQHLLALATTISQFLIFGMSNFLIREAKNPAHNGKLFDKCFTLFIAIACLILPLSNFFLKKAGINSSLTSSFIIVMAILMAINSLISAYFHGVGKFKLTILLENLLPKTIMIIVAIFFYFAGYISAFEKYYIPSYIVIYSLISIPLLFLIFKKLDFTFKISEVKSILFFFGVTITYSLGNNLTKVIQGSFYKNDVALAVISVSISIISLVRVFTSVLDSMIKPMLGKIHREKKVNDLMDVYRFDTRMNSYVSIPLYLFFIICSYKFLLIFGQSYTVYPTILMIMAAANAVSDLTGPSGTLLAMSGNEKLELLNGFIYFIVYFLGIFIFSFDKINGLCFALLFAQIVVNSAKYIEIRIVFKTHPMDFKTILTLFIVILINSIVIFGISFINNFIIWLCVGLASGAALIVLNCCVLSLYRKTDLKKLISLNIR